MKELTQKPQNIVLVGDAFVSPDTMEQAVQQSALCCGRITKLMWGGSDKQEFTSRQLKLERSGSRTVCGRSGRGDRRSRGSARAFQSGAVCAD